VPPSGASAALSATSVVTNASGEAFVTATANGTAGAYTVTATSGAYTASFALANTAAPGVGSFIAVSGTPQSATVGTAFAQTLRVRLRDEHNAPLVGAAIGFAAPGSGASATLSAASAVTDSNGEAAITATANATAGSYQVVASHAGGTVPFVLTNDALPPLLISGPVPGGTATVSVQSAAVPLTASAQFAQTMFADDPASASLPPMPGYTFPFGIVGFKLENVGLGNAVTLRIQYPGNVPASAEYLKHGPQGWHPIPMARINATTIEITLTDGGVGDTDAAQDGTITDPGGLAVLAAPGGAASIPALSPFALALLAAGLGLLGWRRRS
jgi:hypothetical protein